MTHEGGRDAPPARLPTTDETHVRLVLDLTGTDPPAGEVVDGDGHVHRFDGWLGLLGVLSALVGDPAGEPDAADDPAS